MDSGIDFSCCGYKFQVENTALLQRVTIESKTTGATKDHLKQKLWQE